MHDKIIFGAEMLIHMLLICSLYYDGMYDVRHAFFDFACVSKVSKDGREVRKFFRIVCVNMLISYRNLFGYRLNKYKINYLYVCMSN